MEKLKGYKTYIAAAGMVLLAVAAYVGGDATAEASIKAVLEALAFAFVRAGVAKANGG